MTRKYEEKVLIDQLITNSKISSLQDKNTYLNLQHSKVSKELQDAISRISLVNDKW